MWHVQMFNVSVRMPFQVCEAIVSTETLESSSFPQVRPSKGKKASAKVPKSTGSATSSSVSSTSSASSIPQEDPVKRAETLRNKAREDGEKLRDEFWQNLRKASAEPRKTLTEEEKKRMPNGETLKSVEESKASLEKAKALFAESKYAEAVTELAETIGTAALDEELLGQMYHLRGKASYHLKNYFESIRDLSLAKSLFVEEKGETLFFRMRCYLDLHLPNYATLDYDKIVEEYPEYPNIKTFKSKVSGPIPHDFQKQLQKLGSGKHLPLGTSELDLVKLTIVIALVQEFGFEELGKFLFMMKSVGYHALAAPFGFGTYLRDVFSATDIEDISEVFTHFIPEHTTPMEATIYEVMDAVHAMGEGCHLIHRIGYAMCFSLAWTPTSMWNLHSTLFFSHIKAKFDLHRVLWQEYFLEAEERLARGDDDVGYFCNGGIGEIPPPHARIDYLYVTDHGASDYVRLHAVATAHKNEEVIQELQLHVPLNTFHVTLAPMIFAAARDAMPHSVRFMIQRGAEVNIMDAAEETPLDAAHVAMEFRLEMLHDNDSIVPVEEFQKVQEILTEAGAKHSQSHHGGARTAFEHMFGGGDHEDDEDEHPFHHHDDDEEHEEEDYDDDDGGDDEDQEEQ